MTFPTGKNKIPKIVVTFCINASNPRGFCLLNNSLEPPERAVEALSFLAGCIITAIIINIEIITNNVNNTLYKRKTSFSLYSNTDTLI